MRREIHRQRIERLQARLDALDLDGVLITHLQNLRYCSGFSGSAGWLFVGRTRVQLFVDGRYTAQAAAECPDLERVRVGGNSEGKQRGRPPARWPREVLEAVREGGGRERIGFEGDAVSVRAHQELKRWLRGTTLVATEGLVEALRAVKDPDEIEVLTRSLRIAEEGLAHLLSCLKPGVRERELAAEFQYRILTLGAEREAFDTIVASGERSTFPHGRASDKVVGEGDVVVLDLGARVAGYHSDLTRTVSVDPVSPKGVELHRILVEAQEAAFSVIRPGVPCREVDRAARRVVEGAGYGEHFTHGLGHGVGLEVHEAPRVGPRSETSLEAGMVITVEPGIYLPGVAGARLEEMVVVTPAGCEILTKIPKRWSVG